jgi:hypothetical protein
MDTEDNGLLVQIGRADALGRDARKAVPKYFAARLAVRLLILTAGLAGVRLAYQLPDNSYGQSVVSNAATGLLVFLAVAPALRAMRAHARLTLTAGTIIAVNLLAFGFFTAGVTQSLLANGAVGVLFVLALDLNINRWLDAHAALQGRAQRRIDKAARLIEAAESTLDYKYAVHDYLGLPRPDKIGGIALPAGATLFDVLGGPQGPDAS